jgi:hypothetical protein
LRDLASNWVGASRRRWRMTLTRIVVLACSRIVASTTSHIKPPARPPCGGLYNQTYAVYLLSMARPVSSCHSELLAIPVPGRTHLTAGSRTLAAAASTPFFVAPDLRV